ncbi:MAG: TetR family transcriptional regulator [Planctomycetaceae bacterium]|nr:TetR family transcriptional regulator [Planctomycetaceae bacterium]
MGSASHSNATGTETQAAPPSGRPRPRQARSRAKEEALLGAAERLLGRARMEEIGVAQIAREAGVSVGTFYTRFRDKDALVPCLQERYSARLGELAPRLLDPERWRGEDTERRALRLVRLGQRFYLRNRGLVRALSLDWRVHGAGFSAENRAERDTFHAQLAAALLGGRAPNDQREREAAGFALLWLGAAFRDVYLWSRADHPHPLAIDEARFARELARSTAAYLLAALPHLETESSR